MGSDVETLGSIAQFMSFAKSSNDLVSATRIIYLVTQGQVYSDHVSIPSA